MLWWFMGKVTKCKGIWIFHQFKGEKAYLKHVTKCSKEILCQHCGKVCKSEKKHQEHEQECFERLQGPQPCKICKQMFSTTKSLRLLKTNKFQNYPRMLA